MANTIKKKPNSGWSGYLVYFLAIAVVFLIIVYMMRGAGKPVEIDFNEVIDRIESKEITKITFTPHTGEYNYNIHHLRMETKNNNVVYEAKIYGNQLLEEVQLTALENKVAMESEAIKSYGGLFTILSFLLPIILIGVFAFLFFKSAGGNNKAFDFARSRAKLNKSKEVTFDDVAGQEEEKEELVEIVDFLKNPKKYNESIKFK